MQGIRAWAVCAGALMVVACGGKSAPQPASASTGDKSVVRCHWLPAAAETEEPCNPQTQGAQVNVTLRDSMREKDKKTQTATCVCD